MDFEHGAFAAKRIYFFDKNFSALQIVRGWFICQKVRECLSKNMLLIFNNKKEILRKNCQKTA